jgi:hypothetical protein
MFEGSKRFIAREIDAPAFVRTLAAAIVLASALAIAFIGSRSPYRHDLEIAASILVGCVLVYGIYAALNAEPPERSG